MRFWGAITRGVGVLVRAGPLTRALCPKARSPDPITTPETFLERQAVWRQWQRQGSSDASRTVTTEASVARWLTDVSSALGTPFD